MHEYSLLIICYLFFSSDNTEVIRCLRKKGELGHLLSLLTSTSHTTVYNVYLICTIGVTGMELIGVAFLRFVAFLFLWHTQVFISGQRV